MDEHRWERRALREKKARQAAEGLLEEKSRELFYANESLAKLNADLEREVDSRTEELQAAMQKALSAAQAKADFLATMSHEIRTPLNGVIGMAKILQGTALTPEQQEMIETLTDSGELLMCIINDVLDFAKIDSSNLALESIPVEVEKLIEQTMALHRGIADSKGLYIHTHIDPATPARIMGDPTRLRQILSNFLSNALKFTEEGGVTVGAELKRRDNGPYIRFFVNDTGVGIPEDKLDRIFDAFTQADSSTTREFGGTGLGLAICKGLSRLMDGDVGAISTNASGSTFWLEFPYQAVHQTVRRERKQAVKIGPTGMTTRNLKITTVLLAEDNKINQRISKTFLEKCNAVVTVVENGQEALDALADGNFDALFLDCQMPVLDGFETAIRIRKDELDHGKRHLPIIAMTANALQDDRERCLRAGMDDYLSKPVKPDDLKAMLLRWTEAKP